MLTFAAFLLLCGACAAQPDVIEQPLGGAGPTVIEAQEILSKIRAGEPLNYDNVTIAGSIDLSHLGGPVKQSVKITNSQFQGSLNFAGVTFNEPLDLRGTSFQRNISFSKARFLGDAKFAGSRIFGQADFIDAVFAGL
ncbi:MAG TPA: pentapeptide repeat-containing protein, partial [Methanothrix sp.]|nr:pentapeptide repeat-containing protein [Methanothrix sp.]